MTERERLYKIIENSGVIQRCGCHYNNAERYINELTDYLLANGGIVPPVKCRSKVYTVILKKIEEYEVDSYTVDVDGFSFIHLAFEQNGNIYGRTLSIDDFNKKFYLTREEAEKALKEREENA